MAVKIIKTRVKIQAGKLKVKEEEGNEQFDGDYIIKTNQAEGRKEGRGAF